MFYSPAVQTICIKDSKTSALNPKEPYEILLGNIIEAQNSERVTHNQYYLLQMYDILMCGDVRKIVWKQLKSSEAPKHYVRLENVCDIIKRAPVAAGNGSLDKNESCN